MSALPVSLYEHDELLGQTLVAVLKGKRVFHGAFLDSESEPGIAIVKPKRSKR